MEKFCNLTISNNGSFFYAAHRIILAFVPSIYKQSHSYDWIRTAFFAEETINIYIRCLVYLKDYFHFNTQKYRRRKMRSVIMKKIFGQSRRKSVTQSYRACKMVASCKR